MHHRLLCILACLAAGALSCGNLASFVPRDPSTAPIEAAVAQTEKLQMDSSVAIAIDYLERRGSGLTESENWNVAAAIVSESLRYGFDPNLVLAVIHIESRGDAFALSPVGAMGLMQIMPATGEELASELEIHWVGPQTLFHPVLNVRMGIAYLRHLEERYGSLTTALAAYNWGPGRIDARIRRGAALPADYPEMVLAAYSAREMQRPEMVVPSTYQY
jgi:soluble lytic murein transglycosylase-like protein